MAGGNIKRVIFLCLFVGSFVWLGSKAIQNSEKRNSLVETCQYYHEQCSRDVGKYTGKAVVLKSMCEQMKQECLEKK